MSGKLLLSGVGAIDAWYLGIHTIVSKKTTDGEFYDLHLLIFLIWQDELRAFER